jgi:hypothetical protein
MTADALTRPSHSDRQRRERLFLAAAIGLTLVLAWLLVAMGGPKGNLMAPAGFFAMLIAVPLVLRKPIVGLYILFAAAVLIETDPLTFGLSVTSSIPIFRDLNGLTHIRGMWVNPAEVVIVVAAVGWWLRSRTGDRLQMKPVPLFGPLSAFVAVVALGVVYGLVTGGAIKTALWTVRPLAYFYLAYLLTLQLINDRRQVTVLLWILILGAALKGVIGWWRYYVDLGGNLNGLNQVTGMNSLMAHEESLFYLGIILLAAVQFLYGAPRRQRLASLLAVPLVLLPFLANQRRAGSLALIIAFALLCLMTLSLLPGKRRLMLGGLALCAVLLPVYAAFSWNAESLASEPVRAVKSGISPETRDLTSNEYRDAENYNLKYTARHSPLIGIGFGKEMKEIWPLPDISEQFAWYKIAPHNSILWIMMTTGVGGFILFWYVIGLASAGMLHVARRLPGGTDKGIAVFAMLMLATLLVFALFDQGLLSMRTMIFTGVLLGVAFALPRLHTSSGPAEPLVEEDGRDV